MTKTERVGSAMTGAGLLGLFAAAGLILFIARKASGGSCYNVENIGIGPLEPYYYAKYLGATLPILDAFGETNNDIFTVEFLTEYGTYQSVTVNDIIPHGQEFRFQVVRTTEICNINLEFSL